MYCLNLYFKDDEEEEENKLSYDTRPLSTITVPTGLVTESIIRNIPVTLTIIISILTQ